MQGKGIIRFFLIAFVVVSIIQFLFVLPTNKVERAADRYAEGIAATASEGARDSVERAARTSYLDSMSSETVLKIPLISSFTYQELKSRQLAYGLDLKGGMSVVLQVDLRELIRSLANNAEDPTLNQALDNASEAQRASQTDYVALFVDNWQEITDSPLAELFAGTGALEDITYESSNGDVERDLRAKANETVKLTFDMLKQRIDKLGVSQPNVSLDAARDLINVELPGIDNPERARAFLQAAAALEFWDTYRLADNNGALQNAFLSADQLIRDIEKGKDTVQQERIVEQIIPRDTIYELDSLGNNTDVIASISEPDTIYADESLTGGPLLSKLQLAGYGAVLAIVNDNDRKQVMKYLTDEKVKALFSRDIRFMYSRDPVKLDNEDEADDDLVQYELYGVKIPRGGEAPLEGDVVTSASADPDPQTGQMQVTLVMNSEGARKWAKMTGNAFNNGGREIAIVLDNEVASAPGVNNGAITGGRSSITGNFSTQDAQDLASILEVGKLPARTQIIQESLVGPTLGAENIRKSITAISIGFVLVFVFMLFYYGGGGVVSVIALLLNLVFIFGALASFGAVLTLPGIAGIVLTIGMAVDANVIIYERIREELREGKSIKIAVRDGFQNSYSAIIDANITTFITAMILNYFGLGPIKGFAVVLMIGVVSSVFTAVLVGRLMIEWWLSKDRGMSFWTGASKNAFANVNIDWLGKRKLAYTISGVLIAAGVLSMVFRGFELGVDFKGGYSYNVQFEQEIDQEALRDALATSLEGSSLIVKEVDTDNTFNVVTDYLINDTDTTASDRVMERLYQGVNAVAGGNLELNNFKNPAGTGTYVTSSSKVGPTIADDIKDSAVKASIFALLAIFLYIAIRFGRGFGKKQVAYPVGAVAALFHDVLIVLGLFSLLRGVLPFSMEIDQAFIGAILTVIGYSINDTVVVFDRIREFMNQYTNRSKEEIINMAVNSTISRTVITSLTTLLVVLILFLFGGASTRGLSLALLIGILVGTYSSVFVATPIMSDVMGDLEPKEVKRAKSLTKTGAKAK
ncbi:MAG: protein translocase subunit SecDF [Bacteroidota bacterium]